MGDVAVFKAAQHMGDGIAFADICKELVPQPFPLRRPAHQTRDIDKGHPRRDDLLGTGYRRQLVQPRIQLRRVLVVQHGPLVKEVDGAGEEFQRLRVVAAAEVGGAHHQQVQQMKLVVVH